MSAVGRNAACPCGSGKKYKYCCGAKAQRMPLGTRVLAVVIGVVLLTAAVMALFSLGNLVR
ncbi:MAG TPA: SEC-C metal-binding domain-containing protein [Gammaproteobacteria bacterium]|nr:SEC-C metal-binding domain-containing protein [Gammaproteobacteria bacterium]